MTCPPSCLSTAPSCAGEGEAERVLNPATGELLVALPEASTEQVHKAVSAAHRAFDAWSETTPMERSRLLLKLADAIEARAEEFARLESLNCGKPYARALGDEIPAVADCFRYFAGAARCLNGAAGGRVPGRPHQHDPARPGGRGRLDRAVELPADDGGLEDARRRWPRATPWSSSPASRRR